MEPQQYQDLIKLLQRLLEDQAVAKDKVVQELATAQKTVQELIANQKEIQHLRDKLAAAETLVASKDVIIASKEETISVLRAAFNRPN